MTNEFAPLTSIMQTGTVNGHNLATLPPRYKDLAEEAMRLDDQAKRRELIAKAAENDDTLLEALTRLPENGTAAVRVDEKNELLPEKFVLQCLQNGERGAAELFAKLYKGRVCYDHPSKEWYLWAGHRWQVDEKQEIQLLIEAQVSWQYLQTASNLTRKAAKFKIVDEGEKRQDDTVKKLYQATQSLKRIKYIGDVLKWVASLLPAEDEKWDSNPWILAVANGVIELKTGALRPGRPDDWVRAAAPVTWTGLDTPAPRWEKFMQEVHNNDQKLVNFMQRLYGYAISGLSTEHVFVILSGPQGRNGKDTQLMAIGNVLGIEMAGPVTEDIIISQAKGRSAGSHQAHLMSLRGKRIAWTSESEEGAQLATGQVKRITGGGQITARAPYGKKEITFSPTHLLLLLTNHKPQVPANDDAVWERVIVIEYTQRFVNTPQADNEHQADKSLAEQLQAEASGILAWLVRGLLDYQQQGLNPPDRVKLAKMAYRDEVSTVKRFEQDVLVIDPDAKAPASDLWEAYKDWCKISGLIPVKRNEFYKMIGEKFTKEKARDGNYYWGITLP